MTPARRWGALGFGFVATVVLGVTGAPIYQIVRAQVDAGDWELLAVTVVLGAAATTCSAFLVDRGAARRPGLAVVLIFTVATVLAGTVVALLPRIDPAATTARSVTPDGTIVFVGAPIAPAADEALRTTNGCDNPAQPRALSTIGPLTLVVVDGRCYKPDPRLPVDLSSSPSRSSAAVGYAFNGTVLNPECSEQGERITNSGGRADAVWPRVHAGDRTVFLPRIWTKGADPRPC